MFDKERLLEEWKNFQMGNDVDHTVVRDFIYASWVRCRNKHVDPVRAVKKVLNAHDLAVVQKKNTSLIQSSISLMKKVFDMIASSGSTMCLSSADGVILYRFPHDSLLIQEGMLSCEEFIGTVGIATCIEEKQSLEVFAAEHYCAEFHDFVCSAAPIFDKKEKLIGVVGITSPSESFHPHTRGLLTSVSNAISEQVDLRDILDEQETLINLIDEGVITLDAERCIRMVNNQAAAMFHFTENIRERLFFDIVDVNKNIAKAIYDGCNFNDIDITVTNKIKNISVSCIGSASINGENGGMVLTFREAGRMKEFVSRFTGSKAVFSFADIIGNSKQIQECLAKAKKIAQSDATVLLQGECGTGKELFAQSLHNASLRKGKPFITVNCGALPRELIQSELFGYTEGAFTGASKQGKPGKFELADGGTIFLDEIGEMPLDCQVNLLRVLQNKEVIRIGGKRARIVDIRVIAATNQNLFKAVQAKTFREDLYYRLNVFPIFIPPLRERHDDIILLAEYFLNKFSLKSGNIINKIDDNAMQLLKNYSWPGNIRELENTIERAVYISQGTVIDVNSLNENIVNEAKISKVIDDKKIKVYHHIESEKDTIIHVLKKNHGHIQETVEELGMPRSTFYYKIKKYGIDVKILKKYKNDFSEELKNPLEALSPKQLAALADLARKMSEQ